MDLERLIEIDKNSNYYGLNGETKKLLDSTYPTFNAVINPKESVFISGTEILVSIKLSNFRVKGKYIKPDVVKLNGTTLTSYSFSESIRASKQYDIEVQYKGKSTVKSKVFLILEPLRVLISDNKTVPSGVDEEPWIESGDPLVVYKSGIYNKELFSDKEGYLWIFIPNNIEEVSDVCAFGIIKPIEFEEQKLSVSKEYRAFKSKNVLNSGVWNLMLTLKVNLEVNKNQFMTVDNYTVRTIDGNLLKVVDNG